MDGLGQSAHFAAPKRALIADGDEIDRSILISVVKSLGAEEVQTASHGEKVWALADQAVFDVVCFNWQLPKLSGIGLFNRLRSDARYSLTPMLVMTQIMHRKDFAVLDEFPTNALLEKPFTKAAVTKELERLLREHAWYREHDALLTELLAKLAEDPSGVFRKVRALMAKAADPTPLSLLVARRLCDTENYKLADQILSLLQQKNVRSPVVLTELARLKFLQGDSHAARDLLREAHGFSASNVQRLCFLGQIELENRDPEAARQWFGQALHIDPKNKQAREGQFIADSISDYLAARHGQDLPQAFASLCNTLGVGMAREGRVQEGLRQYRAALSFVMSRRNQARVTFNVGLGYLRLRQPGEALTWFERAAQLAEADFGRPQELVMRTRQALAEAGTADGLTTFVQQDPEEPADLGPYSQETPAAQSAFKQQFADPFMSEAAGEAEDDADFSEESVWK